MRIPTNIVTGFLGVGKTTAILDLLASKNDGERWAVLVNEYGEVSIDHAILEGGGAEGVTVQEVSGGCVCCATAPYLQVALHLLLTEARPHRLIIETTGLGHPGRLIETLRRSYADRLELRATVTLVSPDDFTTPGMLENPVFREQVDLADVLVLNKLDRSNEQLVADFQRWAQELRPAKQMIAAAHHGHLERDWLDLNGRVESVQEHPAAEPQLRTLPPSPMPEPGRPSRFPSASTPPACGWIFSPADIFDESRLLDWLAKLSPVDRLKGVFRLGDRTIVVNRVGESLTVLPTEYRGESRLEVFASGLNWNDLEQQLLKCLA